MMSNERDSISLILATLSVGFALGYLITDLLSPKIAFVMYLIIFIVWAVSVVRKNE